MNPALDREHFFLVTLDSKNRTIGYHMISIGSLSTSIVHPREVWKSTLMDRCGCSGLHP
ncbi:MAG: hypothetical protein GXX84_12640 [Acidobacteria bacterium]|nr:hypothetical protein [Acidobacteriota bacterium]